MPNIALTVLFATRNGEYVLPKTLDGYCRVRRPACTWKLVVVDNGSDDSTQTIVGSFKDRLPLEILQQPHAGKNRALNHGLLACEGPLVIITDDDAVPDPSFLTAWFKVLDRAQEFEIFGGSIDPLFETPPPEWILRNIGRLGMLFAVRDLPEGPVEATAIFGPNMAVRSSVFERGFRFNENIGPNGADSNYPMGSETEFCVRVTHSGAKSWFAREPRVQHIVRGNQLMKSSWGRRAYRHGRGVARRIRESGEVPPPHAVQPFIFDRLLSLRQRLQRFSPSPLQRFYSVWNSHWRQGFRDEWNKNETEIALH